MPHAHPSQHSYLNYVLVDVIRVACWNARWNGWNVSALK
ncbi:hypothetical protein RSAG8_06134, partial [Rhizoctonia solani AG-8 WAC10335]